MTRAATATKFSRLPDCGVFGADGRSARTSYVFFSRTTHAQNFPEFFITRWIQGYIQTITICRWFYSRKSVDMEVSWQGKAKNEERDVQVVWEESWNATDVIALEKLSLCIQRREAATGKPVWDERGWAWLAIRYCGRPCVFSSRGSGTRPGFNALGNLNWRVDPTATAQGMEHCGTPV